MAKFFLIAATSVFTWLTLLTPVAAAPGDVDSTFAGKVFGYQHNPPPPYAVAVQPDKRILIGGHYERTPTSIYPVIRRLNPDGSPDKSFSAFFTFLPRAIAVLSDGKILVAGAHYSSSTPPGTRLMRLMPDGSPDPSFQLQIMDGIVYSLLIQPDGKIVISGSFTTISGITHSRLARLHEDGSIDADFAPAFNDAVYTTALQSDGKILVGGRFTASSENQPQNALTRLHPDGTLDPTFLPVITASSSVAAVSTVAVQADGQIFISGSFSQVNGSPKSGHAILNSHGTATTPTFIGSLTYRTHLSSTPSPVRSFGLQADGGVLFSGSFNRNYTGDILYAGLWGANAADFTSRCPPDARIVGSMLQNDGRLISGLLRESVNGAAQNLVLRLENSPAVQTLTATGGGSKVTWLRSGSAPDPVYTTFEFTTDAGSTWTSLGSGQRITGGWELDGLTLPAQGEIRARGRIIGGYGNGSSGLVEQIISLGTASPQLVLLDPAGSELPSSSGTFAFGAERRVEKTFTLRNDGDALLSLSGLEVKDRAFILDTTSLPGTLAPGQQASFTVTFDPPATGDFEVPLRIPSNDPATPVYNLILTGVGAARSDASLRSLIADRPGSQTSSLSNIQTHQAFDPDQLSYLMFVPGNTQRLWISWNVFEPWTYPVPVKVNGVAQPYWSSDFQLTLEDSDTDHTLSIEVTAPDGITTKTYVLTIRRLAPKPGDVDLSFAPEVHLNPYDSSTVVTPDEGILLLAITLAEGVNSGLRKIDAAGSLDPSFTSTVGSPPRASQQLDDGTLLVLHDPLYQQDLMSHLDASGQRLPTFSQIQVTANNPTSFIRQTDGKFVIGAYAFEAGGQPLGSLIRLLPDGSLDSTFQPRINGPVYALNQDADGHILVGGQFTSANHQPATNFVRLNSDGSTFGDGTQTDLGALTHPPSTISVIEQAADGQWYIGGSPSSSQGSPRKSLVRLQSDGSLDTSFDAAIPGYPIIRSLAVQANGQILVGTSSSSGNSLLRLHSNGSKDTSFNTWFNGEVAGLAIAADGQIIVNGQFTETGGVVRWGLARLYNNPATQEFTVTSSSTAQWLRGGTSPEARRVYFEASSDAGNTWTYAGEGTRIYGGWEGTRLALPASGLLRARAITGGGHRNAHSGIVEAITDDFSFAQPIMTVSHQAQTIADGATVNFDFASVTGSGQRSRIDLGNLGEAGLQIFQARITGQDADHFRVAVPPSALILTGETSPVMLEFIPTTTGQKSALLEIIGNDPSQPLFTLALNGEAGTPAPPRVTTLPAADIQVAGAMLQGKVNPRGYLQTVSFEHGPTPALGYIVEAMPHELGSEEGPTEVHALLTDLPPNTVHYYRVHSVGTRGAATGKILSFTTGNSVPIGQPDTFKTTPSSTVNLSVLINDSDPDGDTLSLHSVSAIVPRSAGTLRQVGDEVIFKASPSFSQASFTYRNKDSFGGVSEPIQVELVSGSIQLEMTETPSAQAGSFTVSVLSDSAWSLVKIPAWASISSEAGYGNQQLTLTLSANLSAKTRTGSLQMGDAMLALIQPGVTPPGSLYSDHFHPHGMVATPFEFIIYSEVQPVTFHAKNLPPGLTIDDLGQIRGQPSKEGIYKTSVYAKNAAGKTEPVEVTITIDELPPLFIGSFEGFFAPEDVDALNLGGRFQVKVTPSGSYSGKLILGTQSIPLKGVITVSPLIEDQATLTFDTNSRANSATRFNLTIGSAIVPELEDVSLAAQEGWKIPWNGKDIQAQAFAGLHTLALFPPSQPDLPEGTGFASVSIQARNGSARTVGRLADGSAFTTATFVGQSTLEAEHGRVLLYQSLYKKRGSLAGAITLTPGNSPAENTLSGTAFWSKLPSLPNKRDRLYPEGFASLPLQIEGGALPVTEPGGVIAGLPADNLLTFTSSTMESPLTFSVSLSNNTTRGLAQKATLLPDGANTATLKLKAAQGQLGGLLTIPGSTRALNRKVPYSGLFVRIGSHTQAYGHFLLPQLPADGETLKTSPQISSKVTLGPAASE